MTPDTAAIRERLEKATKGPWKNYIGTAVPDHKITGGKTMVCVIPFKYDTPEVRNNNADFIAHAPADIAALLEENERLRGLPRIQEMDNALIEAATRTERERCVRIVNAECERILSKQTPNAEPGSTADDINKNLRMIAIMLPEIASAIEADHGE